MICSSALYRRDLGWRNCLGFFLFSNLEGFLGLCGLFPPGLPGVSPEFFVEACLQLAQAMQLVNVRNSWVQQFCLHGTLLVTILLKLNLHTIVILVIKLRSREETSIITF